MLDRILFSVKPQHESAVCVCESPSVMSDSLRPHGLYSLWNSPGQNTGVGSLSLLQGIFPTQESNQYLLLCWRIIYQLSYLPQVYIYSLLFEPPSPRAPHPTPLGWYRPGFEFPEPYSNFPLAVYFAYVNVSFHVTLSMRFNSIFILTPGRLLLAIWFSNSLLQTVQFIV